MASPHRATVRACATRWLVVAIVMAAGPAVADICKYADADGNVHYSNLPPEKGWRRLSCASGDDGSPRRSNGAAAARSAPSPAGFPRVDSDTQRNRDDIRRKVLNDELNAEQKLLAEARTQYADGAPVPLPEERSDAEKYRARIARLRQAVSIHEKNVEALKKELATVK
jgi:hypothetical protein